MTDTRALTQAFLDAAQSLGDHMLADLQARDPSMAAAVAHAYANGECLQLAFVVSGEPRIELQARNDYQTVRLISHIDLSVPTRRRH